MNLAPGVARFPYPTPGEVADVEIDGLNRRRSAKKDAP